MQLNARVLALLTAATLSAVLGWRSFATAQNSGIAVFSFAALLALVVLACTIVERAELRPSLNNGTKSLDSFSTDRALGFASDPIESVVRATSYRGNARRSAEPIESSSLALAKYPRILLATTDTATKKQYLRAVAGLNYPKPEIAGDGFDVIELISRKHYDFILMDCDLPFLDAQGTAKLARTIESLGSTSIVVGMKSESNFGDHTTWCHASPTNLWLEKPLDAAAVKNVFLGQPAAEELCLVE